VLVDGHDILSAKEAASRGIGWVPEFPNFEPGARALEHLVYLAGFHGIRPGEARARGRELLARVALGGVERGKIRTFSQGMKKRYALAAAMLADPPNYLLDEVLNGLDPEGIHFVREWLREGKRANRATLLSSHILSEVQLVADRIAVIHHGRILRTLRVDELAGLSRRAVRLEVDNLDPAGLEFLGTRGEVTRLDATHVRVEGPDLDPATLNQELVQRGYRISRLEREQADLEAYFLELTRAAG
jgi:ABC-2 type transport system ATP-binding protein